MEVITQKSLGGWVGVGVHSPSAAAAFEDLIVSAVSGRHGGLCWHVSASLLVRASTLWQQSGGKLSVFVCVSLSGNVVKGSERVRVH